MEIKKKMGIWIIVSIIIEVIIVSIASFSIDIWDILDNWSIWLIFPIGSYCFWYIFRYLQESKESIPMTDERTQQARYKAAFYSLFISAIVMFFLSIGYSLLDLSKIPLDFIFLAIAIGQIKMMLLFEWYFEKRGNI